jgi:hypothetical protein
MVTFSQLPYSLAVCRLDPRAEIPQWVLTERFVSLARTDDELSIVCPQRRVSPGWTAEKDWRCLRVDGPLPLDEVGVLSSIIRPLADRSISVFVVSTYDTDYVMVKDKDLNQTIDVLTAHGHVVRPD